MQPATMPYRTLGRTGLRVSLLGLGSGGPSQLGQSSGVAEADAQRLVRHALDSGVNLIDSAADYRESEAILGRALAGVPRDQYVLCTKFNPVARGDSGLKEAGSLTASLERSLARLGVDAVDVFQLHGVAPEWYRPAVERFWPELERAQQAGKCRFLGVTETFASDHEKATLHAALEDDVWDTIMVGYNLLTPRPDEEVLPRAARQNVGVLVMCAVRRAIGRPDKLAALIQDLVARGKLPADALPADGPLDWLIHDGIASVTAAAYQYAAGNPAVSTVLTGTADVAHFDANLRAITGAPLPAADRVRLQALFRPIGENLGN